MKIYLILAAILCVFVSPVSYSQAFDFEDCLVVEVVSAGAKNAHVQLDCVIEPRPECATAGRYFAFDKSTEEGKQYMSMVLTAYATGSKLTGLVNDTQCSPYQGNAALLGHLRMRK